MSIFGTPPDLPEEDEGEKFERLYIKPLELAAKAIGLKLICWDSARQAFKAEGATRSRWNPQFDDGDSLRLMAALHMNVHCASGSVWATHRTADGYTICSESVRFHEVREITECYREAILDVAAKVGERMP